MDGDSLLTASDLAAKLDISVETVHRKCRSYEWPHSRIGRLYRFTQEHYEAIIEPPKPASKPRTQRKNIDSLLRSA